MLVISLHFSRIINECNECISWPGVQLCHKFLISVPRWVIVPNVMALVTYAKVVNVQDLTNCSIVVNFVKKFFKNALLNGNSYAHEETCWLVNDSS